MKPVVIYSTPTCVHCRHAKDYFKANNVAYTEYDVLADIPRRKEMVEKSGQMGVPVITIGNDVIVGFDEEAVAHLLAN